MNAAVTFDPHYHALTVQKSGTVRMMIGTAGPNSSAGLMAAVDGEDPLRQVLPYTKSLFAGLFFQPAPRRVLTVGLGGAAFHRLFTAAFPETLLQTVELDENVVLACISELGFKPTGMTPITVGDGRAFIRDNREAWDWLVLDIFRGLFVPAHVRTVEFYRECAARLDRNGVLVTNLFSTSPDYFSNLATLTRVFDQVMLFGCENFGLGNVIACATRYLWPPLSGLLQGADIEALHRSAFNGRLDLESLRREALPWPGAVVASAMVFTDGEIKGDFSSQNTIAP